MTGNDSESWITHSISGSKLFAYAVGGFASLAGGVYLLGNSHGKAYFAGLIFLLIGPVLLWKIVSLVLNGMVAFRYNQHGIEIPGVLGTKSLSWSSIAKVGIMTTSTYMYGFIKTSSARHIYLQRSYRWKTYVPTNMATLGQGEFEHLAMMFESLRLRAVGGNNGKPSALSSSVPNAEVNTFDADAVLSRYLAKQKIAESSQPARTGGMSGNSSLRPGPVTFGKRTS
jgi:hypothetical protein